MVIRRRLKVGEPIQIGNNWAQECAQAHIASHSLSGPEGSIDYGETSGHNYVIYEIVPKQTGLIELQHEVTFSDGRTGQRRYELECHG